jgi:hypothetical protein
MHPTVRLEFFSALGVHEERGKNQRSRNKTGAEGPAVSE